jgi:hypothetical protein
MERGRFGHNGALSKKCAGDLLKYKRACAVAKSKPAISVAVLRFGKNH